MTFTETNPRTNSPLATVDLYRDIHKGIRAELFGITMAAGSLDPSIPIDRIALSTRVHEAVDLLVSHAAHEDKHVQPSIEAHFPALAERVECDHLTLESRMETLNEMADAAAFAKANQREALHRLYLEVASFTSAYLEHQDVEERVIMPALETAIGSETVADIHHAIVSSIPPAETAVSLSLMLPAMNVDDRAELLGGMRAGAPAEVFEGVWGLAGSVLTPGDYEALGVRLGVA
ncbi:MAG: hemerythrin domain-containing protein [Acidimicrobiia bacterium]|nr:hemerythrin domain-containing protein [Acidimicrobiia bacterium]